MPPRLDILAFRDDSIRLNFYAFHFYLQSNFSSTYHGLFCQSKYFMK